MRINLEWLREWVDFELNPQELANQLTIGGLEVGSIEEIVWSAKGVLVAKVIDSHPHPNADRLNICQVDTGNGCHSVVCGATNVRKNLITAYAPPGAILPDGRTIESVKLRGVASDGMLCSPAELGLADEHSGLLELDANAPLGIRVEDYLRLDDVILDLELTPNRGDCFSILGVSREVAALNGKSLKAPVIKAVSAQIADTFPVVLESKDACPRFVGRVIRGVSTGGCSPSWMRERLRRSGVRAIHPIVDITNYVMLELGQPLHSYNLEKLSGAIHVRYAETLEKITLLDGSEIELDPNVLVIADDSGPVGLAGIMGGDSTAVESTTTDIFLEAAFFTPASIMGRARKFGLHTEASLRFERGVDPEHQSRAIERATELLLEISGGRPGPITIIENKNYLPSNEAIPLRHDRLESVLGLSLNPGVVESSLGLLKMTLQKQDNGWLVIPPKFRFDLAIEEDLIEEVGRMVGYDSLPLIPEIGARQLGLATEKCVSEDRIVDRLIDRGYSEIISYSFVEESLEKKINPNSVCVRLANPISKELGVMRGSLWPGLLTTAKRNLSRQRSRVRIFEVGTQFSQEPTTIKETRVVAGLASGALWPEHWKNDDRDVDFFDMKADLEALFELADYNDAMVFSLAEHPALTAGKTARIINKGEPIGWLGELHPELQQSLDIKTSTLLFSVELDSLLLGKVPTFKAYSKYPSIRRDLALVLDEAISSKEIADCIREVSGKKLRDIKIFDVYRGKGIEPSRKSLALGLILQDTSRTLTDADVDQIICSVTSHLERVFGAKIRT
jgi:phenylalanyl-tRNA synthetase beta chain